MKMKENTLLSFCVFLTSVTLSAGQEEASIRLAGGRDDSEGRVEIFHDGTWGTVCDDGWDINDAHVVCRQLQFPGATEAPGSATFGSGDGTILMDSVDCAGTEINFLHCAFPGWGRHDCSHTEDAGVRCENEFTHSSLSHEYDSDHNASLSHRLGELFDSGRDCDMDIAVVVDNNTTGTICAHRVILSLNPDLKASHPDFSNLSIGVTSDCSQHAFNFVRYFYTRKIDVTVSAAHCILKMAFDWGEEVLQEVYLRYLVWNCEALIRSPAWTNLPFGLVKALLSRSDLVVRNETVILNGVERWAAAQENTTVPEILLKLIRFPMIPAEDLYTLEGSRYYASKLQGFQFNALPFTTLRNDLTEDPNVYTSRIYTGRPWGFTFNYDTVRAYKDLGFYALRGQRINHLTSDFQTPVHNSAYFTFQNMRWKTRVYISDKDCSSDNVTCPSLPAVSLKIVENYNRLPGEIDGRIRYSNRLVVKCEGRHVVHVDEFNAVDGENHVFFPNTAKQFYPCYTNQFSYQVVVRPHYSTD